MDGGSLADVLVKVGRIPENVLSRITARVLQGLTYLHRKHLVCGTKMGRVCVCARVLWVFGVPVSSVHTSDSFFVAHAPPH